MTLSQFKLVLERSVRCVFSNTKDRIDTDRLNRVSRFPSIFWQVAGNRFRKHQLSIGDRAKFPNLREANPLNYESKWVLNYEALFGIQRMWSKLFAKLLLFVHEEIVRHKRKRIIDSAPQYREQIRGNNKNNYICIYTYIYIHTHIHTHIYRYRYRYRYKRTVIPQTRSSPSPC